MTTLRDGLDTYRRARRSKHKLSFPSCASGTIQRSHPSKPNRKQVIKAGCKKLSCSACSPYKSRIYKAAVKRLAQEQKLVRLVTLTLDPGLIPKEISSEEYIQQVWTRFRSWLLYHKKLKLTYIRVIELQQNGTAHYHLCLRECISQDELIQAWRDCGGGHQCRISIPKGRDAASYSAKYISKQLAAALEKGTRVVVTSRGLVLFPQPPDTGWRHYAGNYFWIIANHTNQTWRQAYESAIGNYFEYETPPTMEEAWTFNDTIQKRPQAELCNFEMSVQVMRPISCPTPAH